jgi:hypothetical protein
LKELEERLTQRFEGRLDAFEERLVDRVAALIRDSETRLLQAFYSFTETNQSA